MIYYDDEGREIRRCGGRRGYNRGRTSTEYNYIGQPLAVHHRPDDDSGLRIDMDYDYDIDGRLHESATRLSSGASDSDRKQSEVATAWYQYDHVGRIEAVTLGKTITRSFTYDIHGWLTAVETGISSTLGGTPHRTFAETLRYADGRYPAYNGNISSKTTADGTYDYRYDTLNRLTDARFSAAAGKSHNYSASYGYDCRTNLTSIRRRGLYDRDASGNEEYDEVDDISISLDGNRAVSVDNYGEGAKFEDVVGSPSLAGMALTYDDAGRLRSDETRGIVRIDYNNDGLPTRVWFADGHSQLDSYDGLGRRLSTACYEAVTPVVAGKIPSRSRLVSTRYYYGDGTVCQGDSVIMTRFDGGYFDAAGTAHYELADYQGNITDVVDSRGNIVSHTGYYPYGQPWRRPADMQRLYGGKEWLGADGRDEYDFHARRHAPHLARFTTPDPMAEKYYDISPYAYCAGNPIFFTDPTGDSLYVAPEYRETLNNSLREVFGKNADNFQYTESGMLTYNGDKKGMTRNQKSILNDMDKKILSTQDRTELLLGKSVTFTNNDGETITKKALESGGALSILASDKVNNMGYSIILVDPSVTEVKVFELKNANDNQAGNYEPKQIKTNVTDMIFHEMGHKIMEGQTQDKVLEFNNRIRRILKLNKRKPDEEHNQFIL